MQEIMTPKEVARYLHISLLTVYKYANQGTIPAFRIGNSWRFDKKDIDQALIWLDRGLKKIAARDKRSTIEDAMVE